MGLMITRMLRVFAKKDCRILMLGLDAAGKTIILYRLKLGEIVHSVPTIGFNLESVQYKRLNFQVWDIGGQTKIRHLWNHYYENAQALIYVVDSSDTERFTLAKETLAGILEKTEMKDVPVLVFANKQDSATTSVSELADKIGLLTQRGREWYIQGTCGLTGDGLLEGLEWISKKLQSKNSQK